MGTVRILAYDGGGIHGITNLPTSIELEKKIGPLARNFHFIAGTSSGGLQATSLSEIDGEPLLSAQKLLDLYMEEGGDIFDNSLRNVFTHAADEHGRGPLHPENIGQTLHSFMDRLPRQGGLIRPKYNPEKLSRIVSDITGNTKLSEIDSNLLLTTYDIENRIDHVHKSWKARNAYFASYEEGETPASRDAYLKDVLLATTAAPTYFPSHPITNMEGVTTHHIDGGVWANNPSHVALSAARKILGYNHDFLVVSLGTGKNVRPLQHEKAQLWGKLGWATRVVDVLMDGSGQNVSYHMEHEDDVAYVRFQTDMRRREGDPIPNDDLDAASSANREALLIRGQRMRDEHMKQIDQLASYFNCTPITPLEELVEERRQRDQDPANRPRRSALYERIRASSETSIEASI